MIPACAVVRRGSGPAVIISADIANAVLKTLSDAADYTGGTINVVLTAEPYSASPLIAALVPGPFPSGFTVRLTVVAGGKVSGAGGAGGRGYYVGTAPPLAGQAGGTAIEASAVAGAGFTFELDNQGEIRGGGSGGGGAPAAGGAFAGGGGDGGQGRIGGNCGPGGDWDSITGSGAAGGQAGSPSTPGLGGAASGAGQGYGADDGYRGGDGGDWGLAGGAPSGAPTGDPNFDGPPIGGAAGKSINGHSLVTVLAAGTLIGPTAG